MKSFLSTKNLVAIALILFGCILAVRQNPSPKIDDVAILNIDKPTDAIINIVNPISKLVTDPTDRAKLAIFNQEFAKRVLAYNANNQQVNDVYVLAGSKFFNNDLVDKYKDLDVELVKLLESSIGSENHIVTQQEKEDISTKFMGLAWALIQK
jgi:hypothetical protein